MVPANFLEYGLVELRRRRLGGRGVSLLHLGAVPQRHPLLHQPALSSGAELLHHFVEPRLALLEVESFDGHERS